MPITKLPFRFPKTKLLGVLIGFGGAMLLIFFPANRIASDGQVIEHSTWTYAAFAGLIVFATLCYGVGTNLIKKYEYKLSNWK